MELEDIVHIAVLVPLLEVVRGRRVHSSIVDNELEFLAEFYANICTESSVIDLLAFYLLAPSASSILICELAEDLYALNLAKVEILCLQCKCGLEDTLFFGFVLQSVGSICSLYFERGTYEDFLQLPRVSLLHTD